MTTAHTRESQRKTLPALVYQFQHQILQTGPCDIGSDNVPAHGQDRRKCPLQIFNEQLSQAMTLYHHHTSMKFSAAKYRIIILTDNYRLSLLVASFMVIT
jgi:hypothetical protein